LVAAVSNAGGCGILGTVSLSATFVREAIRRVRELTSKPFGVNVVLPLLRRAQLEVCLEERVPLLVLFWGDPSPYVTAAHAAGTKVFVQIGSADEAIAAVRAGADGVIAQGFEAGGHVRGTTALSVLVPSVVDAIDPAPVIAAGGIADGRGYVAAIALGAQGVCMGTRFLATTEANAAEDYKRRVTASGAEATVYTEAFDVGWGNAPHRVLRNESLTASERTVKLRGETRPKEGTVVGQMTTGGKVVDIPAYSAYVPEASATASMDDMALYAGQSCALITEVKPAAEVMRDIVNQAALVLSRLGGKVA
jgi:NAD(P)H-dependent flavin oxidoreductase YrpB (nitropropane dioxygenase family)